MPREDRGRKQFSKKLQSSETNDASSGTSLPIRTNPTEASNKRSLLAQVQIP